MASDHGVHKTPVVFPFLIEEPKCGHQDTINLTGLMTTSRKRQSGFAKDAFPPSKSVLHLKENALKGLTHNTGRKITLTRSYSRPNVVDMQSNIIFCHDHERQPKRIVNGFFPNKIRSAPGSNDAAARNGRGRSTSPSQVCE